MLVGREVGEYVGRRLGITVGSFVGVIVGSFVGRNEGLSVGTAEGLAVEGLLEGEKEGVHVGACMIVVLDGNAVGSKYVTDLFKWFYSIIRNKKIKPKRILRSRGDHNRSNSRITAECRRANVHNGPESNSNIHLHSEDYVFTRNAKNDRYSQ